MRETYEWCNIWWDNPEDKSLPRVLLIGDSITCGYADPVTRLLEGQARVDRLGTSKCIADPGLQVETSYLLGEYSYSVIHVNNGLHGFHLSNPEYENGLRSYMTRLQSDAGDASIIWANSTPITITGNVNQLDAEKNSIVLARNRAAQYVMQELGVPVNDLYDVVDENPDVRLDDGYHYLPEGYELLAKAVYSVIERYL